MRGALSPLHTQGGRPGQSDEVTSHQLLDQYISAGGNFIDTADVYQHGMSERIIGQYLVKKPELRSRLIIATKVSTLSQYWRYSGALIRTP